MNMGEIMWTLAVNWSSFGIRANEVHDKKHEEDIPGSYKSISHYEMDIISFIVYLPFLI